MDKRQNAEKGSQRGIYAVVFWLCVAGTFLFVAAGVWFFLQYQKHSENIAGRVVVLEGVQRPGDSASTAEVSAWVVTFEKAMPGCRCALGATANPAEGRALLFCVGFVEGENVCGPDESALPKGAAMKVSKPSDTGPMPKVLFLMDYLFKADMISPKTDRVLAPGE